MPKQLKKRTALRIREFSLAINNVPTDLRSRWVSTEVAEECQE